MTDNKKNLHETKETDQLQEPIAIVGMSCVFPGAENLAAYWQNIKNGVDAITQVPESRWESIHYDPDSKDVDKIYCHRGGFIDDYASFDPLKYGVMPKAAKGADPDQLMCLRVGIEALEDAGYAEGGFNREKAGVIIGRGNYIGAGVSRLDQHVRGSTQVVEVLKQLIPDISEDVLQKLKKEYQSCMGDYDPDTAVGLMPNLTASRLANRLDLGGPAYTLDAACASSILAVEQGARELRTGNCDLILAGGVHLSHHVSFWSIFCQMGALSRKQQIRPFDQRADGILAGEGVGMVVLKRLSDAERDGDRIYSVIRGVAVSSDGRAASLLSPAVEGQLLALNRAWSQTSLDPELIGYVEAHGTGTANGDAAELETLKQFFGQRKDEEEGPGLGSVKSMIGHAMPAAGIAGLIKTAMAVYEGVIPPTLHCEEPNKAIDETRFRLPTQAEPWLSDTGVRVGAVNAFGFGGINGHVVIENYSASPVESNANENHIAQPVVDIPAVLRLSADTNEELANKIGLAITHFDSLTYPNEASVAKSAGVLRIAIVEPTLKRLEQAKKVVTSNTPWPGRQNIYFSPNRLLSSINKKAQGKLAFIFPGVDSTFEPKVKDIAKFMQVDAPLYSETYDPAKDLEKVAFGLGGVNQLLFKALDRLNIVADAMAGHSIGEWDAMLAAGIWSEDGINQIRENLSPGTLEVPGVEFLAVGCGLEQAESIISEFPDLAISHDNCPHQVIIVGGEGSIDLASQRFQSQQIFSQRLPFKSGFHSSLFTEYLEPYRRQWNNLEFSRAQVPVWSATSCDLFPGRGDDIRDLAIEHLVKPVRFSDLISNMYDDGVRVFLQVGTGSLPGFIGDILKSRPHLTLSANSPKRTGLAQLCHTSAALWVEGMDVDWQQLSSVTQHQQVAPAQKASAPIQLELGVPLVDLKESTAYFQTTENYRRVTSNLGTASSFQGGADALASNSLTSSAMAGGSMMNQAFMDVLGDIHQAGEDVLSAWGQYQQRSAAAPSISQGKDNVVSFEQAKNNVASKQSDQVEIQKRKAVYVKHLDVNTTIPEVIDHSFFPQKPGWPVLADANPIVPLTMEVLMMRDAAKAFVGERVIVALRDISAFNWLSVAEPIDINIVVEEESDNELTVSIEGYAKATAIVADSFPEAPIVDMSPFENEQPALIDADDLYRTRVMFHRDAYQGITRLGPLSFEQVGVRGLIKTPKGPGALLDNAAQLAGYWIVETQATNRLSMPIGIDTISFYSDDPAIGEEVECKAQFNSFDDEHCSVDINLVRDGQVYVQIDSWNNRRFHMDDRFWNLIQIPQWYGLSEQHEGEFVHFDDTYDKAISREYIAGRLLTESEKEVFKVVAPRERRQWLNNRIIAKDAVRGYLWRQHGGHEIYPAEVTMHEDGKGGYEVVGPQREKLNIAMACCDRISVARVTPDKQPNIVVFSVEGSNEYSQGCELSTSELGLIENISGQDFELLKSVCLAAKGIVASFEPDLHGQQLGPCLIEGLDHSNVIINGIKLSYERVDEYVALWW